jgi:hypothetical protein
MAWAPVPKAAVDEHRQMRLDKDKICSGSQIGRWSMIDPISKTQRINRSS